MLRRVVWYKLTEVSEVLSVSIIALMMEAVITSETSVNFYQTIRSTFQMTVIFKATFSFPGNLNTAKQHVNVLRVN
jgi:kynureninase